MKVNWGVLGTANIAAGCTIPGLKLAENANLYAVAGRNEEKVNDFVSRFGFEKGYVGYEKLLEDENVQAVYIPLPNHLHKEWVLKALKAGKHVLCEKPMAMNAADAEEMYRTAEENGVILMEAYAYLHSPYIAALKEDIKLLGEIKYIDTAFVTQGYKEDIRLYKEFGGGMMYDLGCYCTTMILSLIDSEISYVKAVAEMTDKGVDAFSGAIIGFENGTRASFNVGMVLGTETFGRFDRLYIHGSEGAIRSEVEYNGAGELSYRIMMKNGETIVRTIQAPQNYSLETAQLGRCILDGEKQFITPEFSVKNAKLLDALLEEIGY